MLATMLLSHPGDGGAEATWLRHNVDVESCWRQCCRLKVVLIVVRLRSPRAQSFEVLSQREEVGLACQSLMMFMLAHR
jgi:hypothetical protein